MAYPCISFNYNKAVEVNDEFELFTGYIRKDIIGKSKDEFRRIFKIPEFENVSNGESFYLLKIMNQERLLYYSIKNRKMKKRFIFMRNGIPNLRIIFRI